MNMRTQTGMTYIELVTAITVIGILSLSIALFLNNSATGFMHTVESNATEAKLRYASERMAREIHAVRHNGTQYQITTMTASQFDFTKIDGTQVSLSFTSPVLSMSYNTPAITATLSDSVSSFSFSYLQKDGSTFATNAVDVRFVDFNLILGYENGSYPVSRRIALRNRE